MTWTDELKDKVRALAKAGLSAAEISREIGKSRSAVLSMIWRHGIRLARPRGGDQVRRPRRRGRGRGRTNGRDTGARPDFGEPMPKLVERALDPRLDLDPLHVKDFGPGCSWICGDPATETWGSCGRETVPGKPYCPAHCKRAYIPPEVLKKLLAAKRAREAQNPGARRRAQYAGRHR